MMFNSDLPARLAKLLEYKSSAEIAVILSQLIGNQVSAQGVGAITRVSQALEYKSSDEIAPICQQLLGMMSTPPVTDRSLFEYEIVETVSNEDTSTVLPKGYYISSVIKLTVKITKYKGGDSVVNIPPDFDGLRVTAIGEQAFFGCTGVTNIMIPEGVTSIGNYAFYCCYNLTSITIPSTVTSIGVGALGGCRSLASVTVAAGNPVYHSTRYCLIETATKTLHTAYPNCIIPTDGSVTSIGAYAFVSSNIAIITIPDGVTKIDQGAFYECKNLMTIAIPYSVMSVGAMAFYGCTAMMNATIGGRMLSIGEKAFYGCNNLMAIWMSSRVRSIGAEAFFGCSAIKFFLYEGTVAQWNSISRGDRCFAGVPSVTIKCGMTEDQVTKLIQSVQSGDFF